MGASVALYLCITLTSRSDSQSAFFETDFRHELTAGNVFNLLLILACFSRFQTKETIDRDSHTAAGTGDVEKETEVRRIGPQLAPDAMAPSGGIGPALPEHLMRARMAAAAVAADETSPIDLGDIGPLPPGNEIVEELRHTSEQPRNAVGF